MLGALWLFSAAPAEAQSPVWSATLTVGDQGGAGVSKGCFNTQSGLECSSASVLSDDDFVFGGMTFRISDITLIDLPALPAEHGNLALTFLSGNVQTGLDTLKFCAGSTALSFSSATHNAQNLVNWGTTSLRWLAGEKVSLSIVPTSSSCPTTASGSLPTSLTLSANGAPREGGNAVIVRATLDNPAPDGLQVVVNLGGTATWGSDYRTPGFSATPEAETVQAAALLKIPAGQRLTSFAIEVVDDAHEDSGETIEIVAQARQYVDFTDTFTGESDNPSCPSGTCTRQASWAKIVGGHSETLILTIDNHEDAETEAARLAAEAAAEAERQRLAAARAAAGGPLSGLALSANSQAVALTPAFSPGVTSYRAEVPAGTTGVSLAPSWGALAELRGPPSVLALSRGGATILARTQVHASGGAAALALSPSVPTGLEVTVLEPDGSGKRWQGTTTTYRVKVVGAPVPQVQVQVQRPENTAPAETPHPQSTNDPPPSGETPQSQLQEHQPPEEENSQPQLEAQEPPEEESEPRERQAETPSLEQTGTDGDDDLDGTSGDDVLIGLQGQDVLYGRGGNDELRGGKGGDELYGGRGADDLYGDRGADRLLGGDGDDTLTGGPGADRFVFFSGETGDKIITDFGDGDDQIVLRTEAFAWPSVSDIIAGVVAQGDRYLVYTLSPGLTVETDVPLRPEDFRVK